MEEAADEGDCCSAVVEDGGWDDGVGCEAGFVDGEEGEAGCAEEERDEGPP